MHAGSLVKKVSHEPDPLMGLTGAYDLNFFITTLETLQIEIVLFDDGPTFTLCILPMEVGLRVRADLVVSEVAGQKKLAPPHTNNTIDGRIHLPSILIPFLAGFSCIEVDTVFEDLGWPFAGIA
jgi:hypothetical protein